MPRPRRSVVVEATAIRSAVVIDNEHSISRAPIQRALRVFGYHSDTRAWGAESRRNLEEFTMSRPDSSTDIDASERASENAGRSGRKRGRPLTGGQEAVFFAITFAVAFGFQLAVILKVADVIAW
jgi:hypothetical protein